MRIKRICIEIAISLPVVIFLLTSCSATGKCEDPDITLPESIIREGSVTDSMSIADLKWSEMFADTLLINLISKTLENNRDMLTAMAKVEELEKRHRIARAEQFPSIEGNAYIDRETNHKSGENASVDLEVAAKLSLSWEVDFFGRLRWANRKALSEYLSSIEAQRAMQMTLVSAVATAYFQLIALDNELAIVMRTLDTRRENVKNAKLRFEGGLTTEIPYSQAQVAYASTAALIPNLKMKIEMKENEISLLAGEFPSDVERKTTVAGKISPEMLKVGIPSDLLKRRPDLRAAQESLKAAMAGVGYAWADRFPRFTIRLDGGLENNGFSGFFTAPLTYMLGELTSPIFSFGKRKAKYEAAIKVYDQTRYQYEKSLLTAFKEVNDAVTAYRSARENVELMDILRESSRKYVELTSYQHINGLINYIDVLDAQRSYFNAEIDYSNAVRDEQLALISLYKALGGGWN